MTTLRDWLDKLRAFDPDDWCEIDVDAHELVPKRTIEDFLKAGEEDRKRFPRRRYVDVDIPMIDEEY